MNHLGYFLIIVNLFFFSFINVGLAQSIQPYKSAFESDQIHQLDSKLMALSQPFQMLSYRYLSTDQIALSFQTLFPNITFYIDEKSKQIFYLSAQTNPQLDTFFSKIDHPLYNIVIETKIIEITKGIDHYLQSFLSDLGSGVHVEIKKAQNGFVLSSNLDLNFHHLNQIASANIIAQPRITTLDRHPATIQVGDKVPYLTTVIQQQASLKQVHFVDTGIQITFTPFILSDTSIRLHLDMNISSIQLFKPILDQQYPVLSQRQIDTTVHLKSGQLFILGGLIQRKNNQQLVRAPLFYRIPIVKWLFNKNQNNHYETDIMVMIRCEIKKKALE